MAQTLEYMRRKKRERRARMSARGFCVMCCTAKARKNRRTCQGCCDYVAERAKIRAKKVA